MLLRRPALVSNVLIELIIGVSLVQFGLSFKHLYKCRSRECLSRLEKAWRLILRIEWKVISVFPEEEGEVLAHSAPLQLYSFLFVVKSATSGLIDLESTLGIKFLSGLDALKIIQFK